MFRYKNRFIYRFIFTTIDTVFDVTLCICFVRFRRNNSCAVNVYNISLLTKKSAEKADITFLRLFLKWKNRRRLNPSSLPDKLYLHFNFVCIKFNKLNNFLKSKLIKNKQVSYSVGNITNVHGNTLNVKKSRWHELVRLAWSNYPSEVEEKPMD